MKKINNIGYCIIWVIILLIFTSSVCAIGIRPAKTNILFKPEHVGTIKVVNTEAKDMTVKVYPVGDLGKYITINQEKINIRKDEKYKVIEYKLNILDQLDSGIHTGEIVIEEMVSSSENTGHVTASLKISHKITVQVPAQNKNVELKLEVRTNDEEISLITNIKNTGLELIETMEAKIKVLSGDSEVITFGNPLPELKSQDQKEIVSSFNKNELSKGEYTVKTFLNYDGDNAEVVKAITLGTPDIHMELPDKVLKGQMNEIPISLINKWNSDLEGVYADLSFKLNGQEVYESTTKSTKLLGGKTQVITGQFDTKTLDVGKYTLDITLNYAGNSKFENHVISVIDDKPLTNTKNSYTKFLDLIDFKTGKLIGLIILIITLGVYFLTPTKRKKSPSYEFEDSDKYF